MHVRAVFGSPSISFLPFSFVRPLAGRFPVGREESAAALVLELFELLHRAEGPRGPCGEPPRSGKTHRVPTVAAEAAAYRGCPQAAAGEASYRWRG